MTDPSPHTPPRARRISPRVVVLWVSMGVLLGVFLAVTLPALRQRPTGMAALDLVVFTADTGPGVGYAVDFESERAGYPVVMHVDEDGFPSLLFPTHGVAHVEAGSRLRLPDPYGNSTWWARTDERATVLTVLAAQPPTDVDRLVELVERAAASADDPDDALRRVERVLRRRLGEPVARRLEPIDRG